MTTGLVFDVCLLGLSKAFRMSVEVLSTGSLVGFASTLRMGGLQDLLSLLLETI